MATSLVTRVNVGTVLAICTVLVFWCILAAWICDSHQPHVLGQLKKRLVSRAIALSGRLWPVGGETDDEDDDGDGEKEKGDEKRKPSEESGTVCVSPTTGEKEKRKKSRSLSLRFFVRKATGDSGPSRRTTAIPDVDAV